MEAVEVVSEIRYTVSDTSHPIFKREAAKSLMY